MDAGDWIALGAAVVAVLLGLRANWIANRSANAAEQSAAAAGRSATASERSADAAENSAQEAARANELQTKAIEMQATASAAAERRALPTLIVHPIGNRDADDKTRVAQVKMPVQNEGGWCRDIVVITDWGTAPVEPTVLDRGDSGVAIARTEDWEDGYPVPSAARFKDRLGREHELPLTETTPNAWTTP